MTTPKKKAPARKAPAVYRNANGVVDVGRLGSETIQIEAVKGLIVGAALAEANYEVTDERVMLNGIVTTMDAPVKAGDLVLVLTPKQAGSRE